MSIRYRNLGPTKRLHEIVFAGSHDASITSGGSSAQTQNLNIGDQADAGVRLFDLRILAKKSSDGASLVGYHGSGGGKATAQYLSAHSGNTHTVKTSSKMSYGVFGEKLSTMLKQAKDFVEKTNEFLIFKFDKCTNYPLVAEYCVKLLGGNIYKPIGIEFSKLTLEDLKQKVVCVFNDKALKEMKPYKTSDGILGFKSLRGEKNSVGVYDPHYPGLQYYGKGGTKVHKIFSSNTAKMKENEATQKKMLMAMARQEDDFAANVLGMMYWTSTGLTSSIRTRNDVMWSATGVTQMAELWNQGLEASISTQLKRDQIKYLEYGGVKRMKAYFPNIVMIDFADANKCQTIYALNTAADQKLAQAYNKYTKKS